MEEANGEELRRQRDMLGEAHERSAAEARERMLGERERVSCTSHLPSESRITAWHLLEVGDIAGATQVPNQELYCHARHWALRPPFFFAGALCFALQLQQCPHSKLYLCSLSIARHWLLEQKGTAHVMDYTCPDVNACQRCMGSAHLPSSIENRALGLAGLSPNIAVVFSSILG